MNTAAWTASTSFSASPIVAEIHEKVKLDGEHQSDDAKGAEQARCRTGTPRR